MYTTLASISQRTKINLKMSHSDSYCDTTLCLAIKIDKEFRSILALCEIKSLEMLPGQCTVFVHKCTCTVSNG